MKLKSIVFGIACLAFLASCKKDKEDDKVEETETPTFSKNEITTTPLTFEPLNGATVSSQITIPNSTKISGTPPSPSTEINSPVVEDYEESNIVANGSSIVINPSYNTGELAGYYVQVNGSNEYYDIPKSESNNLRKAGKPWTGASPIKSNTRLANTSTEEGFEIQIPESISTGEFCISYCIYDTAGRISNVVSRCVQVQSFGGAGSDFLHGNWTFDYAELYLFTGEETTEYERIALGETGSDTYEIYCSDGSYKEVSYDYTITSFNLNLGSTGGMNYKIISEDRDVTNGSECDNLVYETTYDTEEEVGAWSYDQSNGNFLLLIDGSYSDGGYYSSPEAMQFKAIEKDGQLVLSISEDDLGGSYAVYYFNK